VPDPVRVLWVAKGLGPGGMEQLLVHHAATGDRSRLEYSAAYVVERPNSVVPRLEALGVPCRHVAGGRRRHDPAWPARLVRLVRRSRIDVVHVHSPMVAAVLRPLLRSLPNRPGLVYTEHNSADCYRPPTRWANWATYPLDDARLAVSAAARDSVPSRLRGHTEVLVHGIDVDAVRARRADRERARESLGAGPTDVVVGIVANLRAAKAYPVALDAARRVRDRDPSVRFVSLGQGPLEAELTARHRELGLGDGFRFLGFTEDAVGTMAGFDVFLLSSDVEGLPVSLMEAKALGLPAVVTAVGGIPEMVRDDVDGLLVPPRRPDLLADAVVRLAGDADLRRRLAAGSEDGAGRYDARVAVRRLDDLYLELAARRPTRR
jgi:glycosyltransferase involved in cell wall biosynthesis